MRLQKLISFELSLEDLKSAVWLLLNRKREDLENYIATAEKLPKTCHANLDVAKRELTELTNALTHMESNDWECDFGYHNGKSYFYVMLDGIVEDRKFPSNVLQKNLLFDLHHQQGAEFGKSESPAWIKNIIKEEQ